MSGRRLASNRYDDETSLEDIIEMTERFIRVLTYRSLEVDVSAADYWEMLLDWPAVTKWMPTKDAPVPLVKSVLRDGHKLGTLPCTRDCHFDNSKLPEGLDPSVLPSVLS
jgi:hypothetical protein